MDEQEQELRRKAAAGDPDAQDALERLTSRASGGPAAWVGRRVDLKLSLLGSKSNGTLYQRSHGGVELVASHVWGGRSWLELRDYDHTFFVNAEHVESIHLEL